MKSPAITILPLLAALLLSGGCSDPVSAGTGTGLPLGVYAYRSSFVGGDVPMQRHYRLAIVSQREGYLYDTLFREQGGAWVVDSVFATSLSFQAIGNRYHRAIAIRTGENILPDTTLNYWLFQLRSDSLYTYVGQCYSGSNLDIIGRWKTPISDTALADGRYELNFSDDSVEVMGRAPGVGEIAQRFSYVVGTDSINILGAPVDLGDRYSVTPGLGLYITFRPTHGYGRAR